MHTPPPAALEARAATHTYPGRPDQVRQVRADIRELLDGCPIADDVTLCASELAANAAFHSDSRHPGGTFTVRLDACPISHVRIEVEDNGGPWNEPTSDPSRGRGLDIVRSLAADHGITTTPTGRTVWAKLNWPDR